MIEGATLLFTGDIGPKRKNPMSMFEHIGTLFKSADIVFGQLETNISKRGKPLPHVGLAMRTDPEVARCFKEVGYNVISFASNHCLDLGEEAFLDTIENLRGEGIHVIGAGKNIEEARKPAILKIDGTRIAFLAYNSILPRGYEADIKKPGCAPLRAITFYEQVEPDQPGTPCKIHTFLRREDKEAMVEDIRRVRSSADIVIVSMHFGIHFVPKKIADYQKEAASSAIDAGADLVIGHHPHILKGIEVYKGKAIFYSLGNFALESPFQFNEDKDIRGSEKHKEIVALNPLWGEDKNYPLPLDTRKTMIVKVFVSKAKIDAISILPCWLLDGMEPRILKGGEKGFHEVLAYIEDITGSEGLNGKFVREKDEARLLM